MNSQQVASRARVSLRQLSTWVDKGWLNPRREPGPGRGGVTLDWGPAEVEVAELMGALVNAGVYPDRARYLARGERRALAGLLGALAQCMGDGELTYRWFGKAKTDPNADPGSAGVGQS